MPFDQIISRQDAEAQGLTRYFLGVRCRNGHLAERHTSNGACVECGHVLSRNHRAKKKNPKYESLVVEPGQKRCVGCREVLPVTSFNKDKYRKDWLKVYCRDCVSKQFARWKSTPGYSRRSQFLKDRSKALKDENPRLRWAEYTRAACRARAKKRGVPFGISIRELYDLTVDTCPLLNVPLAYNNLTSLANSATIDRKDGAKGYVPGNVWVISMLANRIKTNATLEQIETLAANLRRHLVDGASA